MQTSFNFPVNNNKLSVMGDMLNWVKAGMPNSNGVKAIDSIQVANGTVGVLADKTLVQLDDTSTSTPVEVKQLEGMATKAQTFYIFTLTGQDVRGMELTAQQADDLIKDLKSKKTVTKKSAPAVKAKTKPAVKSSPNSELLKSTATAVRAASKSIGKAATELDVALDNLEALLKG
jgi:hypothetical protein